MGEAPRPPARARPAGAPALTRRAFLAGIPAVGLGALLAACEPARRGTDDPTAGGVRPEAPARPSAATRLDPERPGFGSLAVGAGGWVTGGAIADDGQLYVRTDVSNGYRWDASTDRWELLLTTRTIPAEDVMPEQAAGLFGIAVAPGDSDTVWCVWNGHTYRSTDGAHSWTDTLPHEPLDANGPLRMLGEPIAVDPHLADVVYLHLGDGLRVTRDGGGTWTQVPADRVPRGTAGAPAALVIDRYGPTQPDGHAAVVYCAVQGEGVFWSTDGGGTWEEISQDPAWTAVPRMSLAPDRRLYAVVQDDGGDWDEETDKAVLRWDPRERSWTDVSPGRDRWHGIAADPTTPGRILLIPFGQSVQLSTDHGETWTGWFDRTDVGVGPGDVTWLPIAITQRYAAIGTVLYDPADPGTAWCTEGVGVWRIDTAVTPAPPPEVGLPWTAWSRGIEELVATGGLVKPPGGAIVLTAQDRKLFHVPDESTYPDAYRPDAEFGMAWHCEWASADPRCIVATLGYPDPHESCFSRDGGATWTRFPSVPLDSTDMDGLWGGGEIYACDDRTFLWLPAHGRRPYQTQDQGRTWTELQLPDGFDDWEQVRPNSQFVHPSRAAADRVRERTFYLYVRTHGVYRSTDGAVTWANVSGSDPFIAGGQTEWHFQLKAAHHAAGHLWAAHGHLDGDVTTPMYRSTDGGATWTTVGDVEGVRCFALGAPRRRGRYPAIYVVGFVSGEYGVYRSDDEARTWERLTTYPMDVMDQFKVCEADKDVYGRVYLGAHGIGWVRGNVA